MLMSLHSDAYGIIKALNRSIKFHPDTKRYVIKVTTAKI